MSNCGSSARRSSPRPKTALPASARRELTTKRRGELAELAFTLKAASLGFGVARPYGDSERYDFILDARDITHTPTRRPPLHRVQVKCSTQLIDGLYRVNSSRRVHGRALPYTAAEIDFFAAYIIPEDTWYILPVEVVAGRASLLFRRRKDRKPGAYDRYREAWRLLRSNVPIG